MHQLVWMQHLHWTMFECLEFRWHLHHHDEMVSEVIQGGLVCAPLHIIAAGEIFHVMVGILLACTLKVHDKHISPVLEEV